MVALQIFLTLLILNGTLFFAMVGISITTYEHTKDPDWLKVVGSLSFGAAFLSLVASLVSAVWVFL